MIVVQIQWKKYTRKIKREIDLRTKSLANQLPYLSTCQHMIPILQPATPYQYLGRVALSVWGVLRPSVVV